MKIVFARRIWPIVVIIFLFQPATADAQSSVWNSSKGSKKTTDTKHKLKDFKEHLQQWGTDTGYNHAFLIGGKLNSDGWSGCMYFVKRKSYKMSHLWEISFSEIKHEKQTKVQGTNGSFTALGNGTPYVFGKINNLYTLQVGYGKEKLLLPAVMEGNLSVSFRYSGGLSLAMLKPYYLKLIYPDYGGSTAHIEQRAYSQTDSAIFLNPNAILGASIWTKSLSDIDYVPGVYLQTAITIIPGKSKAFIQVISLGVNGAYYAKTLPIMADQNAYPWQVSLFAGFAIGKKWK